MALLGDTILAVLAAIGAGTLLYAALRAVFLPRRQVYSPVWLVLPVDRRTRGMEQTVGELQQLRRQVGGSTRILLVDCGMDEEEKHIARILQREDPLIGFCERGSLAEEIGR